MDKLQFLLLISYISYNLGAPSQTILRFCKWTVLNETLAFFVGYFVNRDRDQWRILVATACNGCNYQLNATTDYVTKGRFPLVPRNLPFVLWRQPTTGTGGSCPTARAQQARGAKQPHQKYLRIANTKVSIIKFDALAKVAYRNKHLLFWLPTCLGISSTAWHLSYTTVHKLHPSGPSTHHSHHSLPPHSFIPGLKPSFLQILPTFLFFFRTDSTDSRTVYRYFWAYLSHHFTFVFVCVF